MKILENKKKIILAISLAIFLCALVVVIFLFCNKTILTSSDNTKNINNPDSEVIIPNATEENTTFKISDTENKVENVNISVTNRLSDYNLYYCVTFDSDTSFEINNENYSLLNDTLLIIDENCTIYFKYELNGIFSNEIYEIKISNIEVPEITTEKASDKELKEQKVQKKEVSNQATSPYYIKVNYGANVVTIYTKDKDGKYTVPYKAMVCSCGTYTPKSGTYKTTNKYRWGKLIHDSWGQYATRIVGSILFHSVPYSSNNNDALFYNQYDKLGTTASAGCIRLTVADSKWIYDNCPRGTMVEFYSNSNPGPLGKPSAQKIASVEECRNWDPTDPVSENPWHTYIPEEENTIPDDVPTVDTPSTDAPTTDIPSIDEPSIDTPSTDQPSIDTPTIDTPSTDQPSTDTPTIDTPSTDQPSTDTPTIDTPNTDQPSTDTPTIDTPSTDEPSIDTPTTDEPSTDIPTTGNTQINI